MQGTAEELRQGHFLPKSRWPPDPSHSDPRQHVDTPSPPGLGQAHTHFPGLVTTSPDSPRPLWVVPGNPLLVNPRGTTLSLQPPPSVPSPAHRAWWRRPHVPQWGLTAPPAVPPTLSLDVLSHREMLHLPAAHLGLHHEWPRAPPWTARRAAGHSSSPPSWPANPPSLTALEQRPGGERSPATAPGWSRTCRDSARPPCTASLHAREGRHHHHTRGRHLIRQPRESGARPAPVRQGAGPGWGGPSWQPTLLGWVLVPAAQPYPQMGWTRDDPEEDEVPSERRTTAGAKGQGAPSAQHRLRPRQTRAGGSRAASALSCPLSSGSSSATFSRPSQDHPVTHSRPSSKPCRIL